MRGARLDELVYLPLGEVAVELPIELVDELVDDKSPLKSRFPPTWEHGHEERVVEAANTGGVSRDEIESIALSI